MDRPQSLFRISIPRWFWWAIAVVLVCLVGLVVVTGVYAWRRTTALQRFTSIHVGPPEFVPERLQAWVPQWACTVYGVEGTSREQWQALAAFPEVESVSFDRANLTDDDLQLLRHMRRLVRLYLIGNPKITAAGLTHLEGLPRLADVTVNGASVNDAGLRSLGTLPELRSLDLYGLDLTGTGIPELRGLRKLSYLSIDADHFRAEALGEFAGLTALEELRIYGWSVGNDTVRHLRLPPHLLRLDLRATGIFDDQAGDPVEGLAAVEGIDRLDTLDMNGHFMQAGTTERLCERLGMVETTARGVYGRAP